MAFRALGLIGAHMMDSKNSLIGGISRMSLRSEFRQHLKDCAERYDKVAEALERSKERNDVRHAENQAKLDRINRLIYIATGVGLALAFIGQGGATKILKVIGAP